MNFKRSIEEASNFSTKADNNLLCKECYTIVSAFSCSETGVNCATLVFMPSGYGQATRRVAEPEVKQIVGR